ncbi:serum response factor-binding protein 1-like isoform X2 [Heterocephalus glaber]|uniref:Serum response factor-binding protein 1-like isoform X2 n=1 Tax=Heterocephalus glaber TaxID=10181 RepID=A0AAX6SIA3_HETGA|nr:serum response factor-binding protein 1-like isoform X2 [Heterocephalus glaber]
MKPDSSATERAIARLAEHPLLKKKIGILKAAVQAFKDARQNTTEVKNTTEGNHSKDTLYSDDEESKSQHERTKTIEQKLKEAKTQAKKPINNSKKNGHNGTWTESSEHSKFSLKAFRKGFCSYPSQFQKTPPNPHMKTLNKKKGSDNLLGDDSDSEEELFGEE